MRDDPLLAARAILLAVAISLPLWAIALWLAWLAFGRS